MIRARLSLTARALLRRDIGERTLLPGDDAQLGETRFETCSLSPRESGGGHPLVDLSREPVCVNRPNSNERLFMTIAKLV